MSYFLKSSMTDRLDFDAMAFNCGVDAFKAYTDGDPNEAGEMAAYAWDGTSFQDTNPPSNPDPYDEPDGEFVDDLEEAKFRWLTEWARGYRAAWEWRQADLAEDLR